MRTVRLVHLRVRRERHVVSQHFDRRAGCRGVGFFVPFEVSFTLVPCVVVVGQKHRLGFVNHLHTSRDLCRFTTLVAGGRFGAFMPSTCINSREVTGPTTISNLLHAPPLY